MAYETEFLYDDFTKIDKENLHRIVKTISKKPELQDPKAVFLKRFTYQVFNAYRRTKVSKKIEEEIEIQKKEVKPVILEKPLIKPEAKKFELSIPPKPIYKKVLPIRDIIVSNGVVVRAAYKDGIYNLIEPHLEKNDIILLKEIEKNIGKKITKDRKLASDKEFIKKNVDKIANKMKMAISLGYYEKIQYFLMRDFINFGKIDGLLRDVNIKEIICDGLNTPLRLNYLGDDVVSDVVFIDKTELDSLIKKFADLAGKKISEKEPFLSATLPSGIRIQASLSSNLNDSRFVIKK